MPNLALFSGIDQARSTSRHPPIQSQNASVESPTDPLSLRDSPQNPCLPQVGDIDDDQINHAIYDMYKGTGTSIGIPELREKYGADLVQLLGFFPDSCGIG